MIRRRPWQLWTHQVTWNRGHTTRYLSRRAARRAMRRSTTPATIRRVRR